MRFIHSPLTWAFLLALVPLLIHLINMMRHKRVKWAAMEFLLAAYKKHRKWIWLKQLLLMATRMAIVALIVAMLAQLVTRDRYAAMFGETTTHHYLLLDDSYSMADSGEGVSAFDRAKQVVGRIASQAVGQNSQQRLTLIRYSRAAAAHGEQSTTSGEDASATGRDDIADLHGVLVDSEIDLVLEEKRQTIDVSQLAVGPEAALDLVRDMQAAAPEANNIVYLVSDFRIRDWNESKEIQRRLIELKQKEANEIHLISCVKTREPNLAITALEAAEGTRAAGVPLYVNVTVANYGTEPVQRVQVRLRSHFYDRDQVKERGPAGSLPKTEELPVAIIDEIKPGEAATRRVQVYFPSPGEHVVEAELPADPVAADNNRWCVIDFPEGDTKVIWSTIFLCRSTLS